MELQSLLHYLYIAAMALGFLLFFAWRRDPRWVPQYEYALAMFIPAWSGLAYLSMALGQGETELFGRTVYFARYLDWTVTTPLLVLALGLTAMVHDRKDGTLLAAMVGADVVMILCGLIADFSPEPVRFVWYALGVAAFLALLALVWGPLQRRAASRGPKLYEVWRRPAQLLTALWVIYPTVWLLSPSGLGLIGDTASVLLFVVVPIISKVGWSILDLSGLRSLEGQEIPPATVGDRNDRPVGV